MSSVSGRRVRTKSAGFDGTAAPRRRWGKNDAGFQFFVFSHQLRSKRQSPPSSSSKTSFVLSKTWIFPSAGRTKIFLAWPSSLSTSTTRAIFHDSRDLSRRKEDKNADFCFERERFIFDKELRNVRATNLQSRMIQIRSYKTFSRFLPTAQSCMPSHSTRTSIVHVFTYRINIKNRFEVGRLPSPSLSPLSHR